jgi:predicted enzyme related to lactoylglutathione lyase
MANTFIHFELNTDDVSNAQAFYRKLFKWKFKPMKEMPYTMIETGSKVGGAGLQQKPMPEAPSSWLAYVEVDDVRKTIGQARDAGGQVILEYQPIPGMGAFGVFTDPSGAMLGLWERAKPVKKPKPKKKPAKKAKKKGKKKR